MSGKGQKIRNKVLPLAVTYAGQKIRFDYYIGRMNRAWEEEANEAARSNDFGRVVGSLAKIVRNWDYEEDFVRDEESEVGFRLATESEIEDDAVTVETKTVPLEGDWIVAAEVPTPIIGMIRDAIFDDASSGGSRAKNS